MINIKPPRFGLAEKVIANAIKGIKQLYCKNSSKSYSLSLNHYALAADLHHCHHLHHHCN